MVVTESEAEPLYYDPYDYSIDANPHPVWKRMRDEQPLYRNEVHGFYALSRYDDVLHALLDTVTFSSAHGILLEMMSEERIDIPMMIMMDPPGHTRLRKLVSRAFTPKAISRLEPRIEAVCARLLDPFVGSEGFDYVAEFSAVLPPTVILALLGFPEGHEREVRNQADRSLHRDEGKTGADRDLISVDGSLGKDMEPVLAELMEARRAEPQDDVISTLLHAELEDEDGEHRRLDESEIRGFIGLLALAGTETVARLLSFAAVELARNPDQRQLLVNDPSLIPNGVEELLRFEAPSPVQGRWVEREVELHGQTVPAGSKMLLLNGSADRDERQFENPDRLDVRRVIDRHLAFGYGAHFCVGAGLARLEARIALEQTLKRFPSWEVDEDNLEWVHTSSVRGFASVPMLPT